VTRVKICGVTSTTQALACVDAGVDAIGVNFVSSSARRVDEDNARAIVRAVRGRVLVVGVVADCSIAAMRALRERTGVGCLQLHGRESREDVSALLPHAYKAVCIAAVEDVAEAEAMPGEYVMVDAKVEGTLGGTGRTFDWSLVVGLATRRKIVLGGGLNPENVAAAIRQVRPWCVDVASGIEISPGIKDGEKLLEFVRAVRAAG
jgi:phosphoribosylanthranilate isomerase